MTNLINNLKATQAPFFVRYNYAMNHAVDLISNNKFILSKLSDICLLYSIEEFKKDLSTELSYECKKQMSEAHLYSKTKEGLVFKFDEINEDYVEWINYNLIFEEELFNEICDGCYNYFIDMKRNISSIN